MSHAYRNTRIEFHILQSFPVTCLNRDDVGAPKTAVVGGVTRARVSSQCWKRQIRMAMPNFGFGLATRTTQITTVLSQACQAAGADENQTINCSKELTNIFLKKEDKNKKSKKAKDPDQENPEESVEKKENTLLFISQSEAKAFAEYVKTLGFDHRKIDKKSEELRRLIKLSSTPKHDAIDVALFGRMVATLTYMNVEAAASFSHALSTHQVSNEVEFFTALDDLKKEPGSAHMGILEFNSATYYRYVCLDLGQLEENLGTADLKSAIAAFTKALFVAVPNARQTTQSGASPWEFARVLVRQGQRLQVPFEKPVKARGEGYLKPSIEELKSYLDKKERLSGSMFGKLAAFDWGEDDQFSLDDLIQGLQRQVA